MSDQSTWSVAFREFVLFLIAAFCGSSPFIALGWFLYGSPAPRGLWGLSRWWDVLIQPVLFLMCVALVVFEDIDRPFAPARFGIFLFFCFAGFLGGLWRGFAAAMVVSVPVFVALLLFSIILATFPRSAGRSFPRADGISRPPPF